MHGMVRGLEAGVRWRLLEPKGGESRMERFTPFTSVMF
jgi:hypothetical protein